LPMVSQRCLKGNRAHLWGAALKILAVDDEPSSARTFPGLMQTAMIVARRNPGPLRNK
jgi:hypothetical protein